MCYNLLLTTFLRIFFLKTGVIIPKDTLYKCISVTKRSSGSIEKCAAIAFSERHEFDEILLPERKGSKIRELVKHSAY